MLTKELQKRAATALASLSIMPDLKGYKYILAGLDMICNSDSDNIEDYNHIPITQLYEEIGKKYSTTFYAVERCIRHAVQQMQICDADPLLIQLLAKSKRPGTPVTAGNFLYTIAVYLCF